jgi:hypothetical protein
VLEIARVRPGSMTAAVSFIRQPRTTHAIFWSGYTWQSLECILIDIEILMYFVIKNGFCLAAREWSVLTNSYPKTLAQYAPKVKTDLARKVLGRRCQDDLSTPTDVDPGAGSPGSVGSDGATSAQSVLLARHKPLKANLERSSLFSIIQYQV